MQPQFRVSLPVWRPRVRWLQMFRTDICRRWCKGQLGPSGAEQARQRLSNTGVPGMGSVVKMAGLLQNIFLGQFSKFGTKCRRTPPRKSQTERTPATETWASLHSGQRGSPEKDFPWVVRVTGFCTARADIPPQQLFTRLTAR